MDEIDKITIENIKFHGRRQGLTDSNIQSIIDLYCNLPLINVASIKEIEEAEKKCENTNK